MDERLSGPAQAEKLLTGARGATMDELIAATGGPQYNLLRRLAARGYKIRKVKEGRATRYRAVAPPQGSFEMRVGNKGQVTLPKEVREKLGARSGDNVKFVVTNGQVEMQPVNLSVTRLAGILGKPHKHVTLKQMDEALTKGAVGRHRRTTR
ncbi:MAG: AbrB/MazE/SpoVT family DNA-binding domain-containing protein [Rhizomicrobium sp.]